MRIVFYSTNSNKFDKENYKVNLLPENEKFFKEFCSSHPEHEFICLSQFPSLFMPEKSTIIVNSDFNFKQFAQKVLELKPDLAVALTFWVRPYDWLPVNDSLVAKELENEGLKVITHSVETSLLCFDKWQTYHFLKNLNFDQPKSVLIDHDLYFCAGSNKDVINNVYKDSVKSQIQKLNLPLIIKDTVGLSSYGMTVVQKYGQVMEYLNSKRNNSNRLIQEYIDGNQYGVEIYGVNGNYKILPPFRFSLNQYGITSPKQSYKTGPYPLPKDLSENLLRLCQALNFNGAAQIDLIEKNGKWYILEINPRLSGMTYLYALSMGLSVFELIYRTCITFADLPQVKKSVSIKLPVMETQKMLQICTLKGVKLLNQTDNQTASQEREKGYCECIITSDDEDTLQKCLKNLKSYFSNDTTIQWFETKQK